VKDDAQFLAERIEELAGSKEGRILETARK
jgi:hypothetical protein